MEPEIIRKVSCLYTGSYGEFAYKAFDFVNGEFFSSGLPHPLIIWHATPFGSCSGSLRAGIDLPPIICLSRSLMGDKEKTPSPWRIPHSWLGPCAVFDVLLHECMHLQVDYVLGGWLGRVRGDSSHNNELWIAEVNRIAPLLGLNGVEAGLRLPKRISSDGNGSRVTRMQEGNVPITSLAVFPTAHRKAFYKAARLPWEKTR
jgi:hypothetical protein